MNHNSKSVIAMEIIKIDNDKKRFLDLLLLADKQEDMIDRYLEAGDMFALYDGDLKSICVVTRVDDSTCEIKNIATYEEYQEQGMERNLLNTCFHIIKAHTAPF